MWRGSAAFNSVSETGRDQTARPPTASEQQPPAASWREAPRGNPSLTAASLRTDRHVTDLPVYTRTCSSAMENKGLPEPENKETEQRGIFCIAARS